MMLIKFDDTKGNGMTLGDHIEGKFVEYDIEYRVHASRRMFQRDIVEDDVELILRKGSIIEKYAEDFPLPSLLLNGRASTDRPLHVVVAVNSFERKFIIITAYEPDSAKWTEGFSRRL